MYERDTAVTLWAVPLASAPSGSDRLLGFVEHYVGMVNVGSRAPGVPLFYIALYERGPLPPEQQAPPIRARMEIIP
jgi:hypothetical protein